MEQEKSSQTQCSCQHPGYPYKDPERDRDRHLKYCPLYPWSYPSGESKKSELRDTDLESVAYPEEQERLSRAYIGSQETTSPASQSEPVQSPATSGKIVSFDSYDLGWLLPLMEGLTRLQESLRHRQSSVGLSLLEATIFALVRQLVPKLATELALVSQQEFVS